MHSIRRFFGEIFPALNLILWLISPAIYLILERFMSAAHQSDTAIILKIFTPILISTFWAYFIFKQIFDKKIHTLGIFIYIALMTAAFMGSCIVGAFFQIMIFGM